MCLQVNIGHEESKGGFDPDQIRDLAPELSQFGNLRILGLMCIPPIEEDEQSVRHWFVLLRELQEEIAPAFGSGFNQLSMGMSSDYELAIEEGATVVRVGSAIFGGRDYGG